MGTAFRYGPMVLVIKANGEKTRLMEKVNFGMLMETFLMANGKMIKLMVMACILIKTGLSMKAIGRMTCKMDGV